MYSRVKNCVILICFTIVNKVSFFQVAFGKINKKYNLSSFVPFFLKNKKTSPKMDDDFLIGTKYKLLSKTIDNTVYYKFVTNETKIVDFKPCKYSFTSINLIDTSKEHCDYDINITNNDEALKLTSKSQKELLRRLHVIDNGEVIGGAKAFIIIWSKIPKYNFLAKIFSIKPLYFLFHYGYEIVAYFLFLKNKNQLK